MPSNWQDVLQAARLKVVTREPYYAEALFSLRGPRAEAIGTFAVTDRGVLIVDPAKCSEWGTDGVAAVLSHEVGHWLRDHAGRRGSRDAWAWNIAGDAEINDDVVRAGWKLPVKGPIMPASIGSVDGLTAEEYYPLVQKFLEKQPKGGDLAGDQKGKSVPNPAAAPGSWGDCGGCAHGEGHDKDGGAEDGAPAGMDKVDVDLLRRSTAQAVKAHEQSNGRGSVPLGLSVWADRYLAPPKIDWRRQLRGLTRRMVASRCGNDARTWARLSSRYWSMRTVLGSATPPRPAYYSPVPKVAVVIDTSGSMSCREGTRTRLDLAMSEVLGVVKAIGVPLAVYAVDAAVQARVMVRNAKQLDKAAVGGGGTDMTLGVMEAAAKERPDVLVLVTDGETGWPAPGQFPASTRLIVACVTDAKVPSHLPLVVRVEE